MSKSIGRISVTVQPYEYDDSYVAVRFRVDVNGRQVNFERALTEDDMTSRFDYLFDEAREALRAAIIAERKEGEAAAQRAA